MNPLSCKILLARHGETEWNLLRRLQGNQDSPLTDRGIEQANSLADSIQSTIIDFCYSSQLGRASRTASHCLQTLALDIEVVHQPQLRERDFGTWQGQYFEELRQQPDFSQVFNQVNQLAPPQGESGQACGLRIYQALLEIAHKHPGNIGLVITHGEAIRCLLAILGKPLTQDAFSCITNGILLPIIVNSEGLALDYTDENLPEFLA